MRGNPRDNTAAKLRRPRYTDHSEDELAGSPPAKAARLSSPTEPTASASESRRGKIPQSTWSEARGTQVLIAVREPKFRYISPTVAKESRLLPREKDCFLKPSGTGNEYQAYQEDGGEASDLTWLNIKKGKVQFINWNPESPYIKFGLSADISTNSGAQLVLKVSSPAAAHELVQGASSKSESKLILTHTSFLEKMFNTLSEKVGKQLESYKKAQTAGQESFTGSGVEVALLDAKEMKRTSRSTRDSAMPWKHSTAGNLGTLESEHPRESIRSRMQPTSAPSHGTRSMHSSASELGNLPSATQRPTGTYTSARMTWRDTSPTLKAEPAGWTESHPHWDENWDIDLSYQRNTVTKGDIFRLNEGEFLNDDLIGFGLQHLFSAGKARDKSLEDRVFIHNSFFYQKLKSTGSRINYDGVRSWTARKDILKCDYIVVPVNENYHWWVAIICHPGKLVADAVPQVEEATVDDDAQAEGQGHGSEDKPVNPKNDPQMSESHLQGEPSLPSVAPVNDMRSLSIDSNGDTSNITANQERRGHDHIDIPGEDEDPVTANKVQQASIARKAVRKTGGPGPRKYEFGEPRIITLDSMGNTHSPACQALKQYLVAEFKDKRNQENLNVPQNIGMKALNIPEQKNFSDCGVYLLGYIREFLKDPDVFVQGLLQRVKRDWDFDASELRNDLREQIFELQKEYQKEQKELKKQREQQKKQRVASHRKSPAPASSGQKTPVVPPISRSPIPGTSTQPSDRAHSAPAAGKPSAETCGNGSPSRKQSEPVVAEKPATPSIDSVKTGGTSHSSEIVKTAQPPSSSEVVVQLYQSSTLNAGEYAKDEAEVEQEEPREPQRQSQTPEGSNHTNEQDVDDADESQVAELHVRNTTAPRDAAAITVSAHVPSKSSSPAVPTRTSRVSPLEGLLELDQVPMKSEEGPNGTQAQKPVSRLEQADTGERGRGAAPESEDSVLPSTEEEFIKAERSQEDRREHVMMRDLQAEKERFFAPCPSGPEQPQARRYVESDDVTFLGPLPVSSSSESHPSRVRASPRRQSRARGRSRNGVSPMKLVAIPDDAPAEKVQPKKRKSPSSVNGTSSAKRRRSPSPQSPYWVSPALPTAARPLTAASVPVVTDCRLVRRKPLESMEVEVSRSPGSEVDEGLSPELPARRSTKVPGTIDLTLE